MVPAADSHCADESAGFSASNRAGLRCLRPAVSKFTAGRGSPAARMKAAGVRCGSIRRSRLPAWPVGRTAPVRPVMWASDGLPQACGARGYRSADRLGPNARNTTMSGRLAGCSGTTCVPRDLMATRILSRRTPEFTDLAGAGRLGQREHHGLATFRACSARCPAALVLCVAVVEERRISRLISVVTLHFGQLGGERAAEADTPNFEGSTRWRR